VGAEPEQAPDDRQQVRTLRATDSGGTYTYDPGPDREKARFWLAKALVCLLITVSLGLIVCAAAGWLTTSQAKDMAIAVLSPLVALTGAALGFYFGGDDRGK